VSAYSSKDCCNSCWYDSCESCRGNGCVCAANDHFATGCTDDCPEDCMADHRGEQ
jgi:hypothetical protein